MILLPAKTVPPEARRRLLGPALHRPGVCSPWACTLADGPVLYRVSRARTCPARCGPLALFSAAPQPRAGRRGGAAGPPPPGLAQVASWAGAGLRRGRHRFPLHAAPLAVPGSCPKTAAASKPGLPKDAAIDLNNAGNLELNRDVAFEVSATDNDGPAQARPGPPTRGGAVPRFRYYFNGRWTNTPLSPVDRRRPHPDCTGPHRRPGDVGRRSTSNCRTWGRTSIS